MDMFMEILSGIFLLIGALLVLAGGIGLIRFPDFYTRMHATGVTDTLASTMIIIGMMLLNPGALVIMKLIIILLLILLTSPTAGHALAKAAFRSGLKPISNNKSQQESKSSKR